MTAEILQLFSGTETVSTTQPGKTYEKAWQSAMLVLDITALGLAVTDTLDVLIDTSPDGGASWVNVGHFNQVLGTDTAGKQYMSLIPAGGVSDVGFPDLVAGATRPWSICDRLRARSAINVGGTATFTYSVTALLK